MINFATCVRGTALEFVRKVLPSMDIEDTPESAGPFLDFVERDIVRVQDPMMYGNTIAITPSKNWDELHREPLMKASAILNPRAI